MNKFDLAEALIAIADTGSIYKAAGKLHQTSAAISKKLSKLEAYLSIQLVYRERNGLRLTAAGQHYYHEAKKAVIQFTFAERSVAQELLQPRGQLKIVAKQYYIQNFILPKLPGFLANNPYLNVNLDSTETLPNFNVKKMDILFGCAEICATGEDNLIRKQIDISRYVLCASPAYLKRKGIPKTAIELLQHDFIAHGGRKKHKMIILDNNEQVITEPKLVFNNTDLIIQATLANLGFIWIDNKLVSDLVVKKKLVCLLDAYTQESTIVYLFYERQYRLDPKIRAFIDFFVENKP